MERIIAVLDQDPRFGERLCAYANQRRLLPLQAAAFQDLQSYLDFAREGRVALLLAEESLIAGEYELYADRVLTLGEGTSEGSEERLAGCDGEIRKYQSGEALLRELLEYLGEPGERPGAGSGGSRARVTGVYSPLGRCCKTAFALLLALTRGRESRVLFLSLEVFSGLDRLLSLEFASSLSDALYHLRHNSLDAGRIGTLVQRMGDVDLLPPCRSPEDLLEGTGAGCGELLETILRETEYDHVILDLGSFSGASAELMELCDIIYMPSLKDRVSQGKVESFTAYLEGAGRNRILEGLRKVELSESCLPRPGENYLEGLLLSPLGDQVRGLSL